MRPFPKAGETSGRAHHLVVVLAEGWRLGSDKHTIVGPPGVESFAPRRVLPARARLEPMIPDLWAADSASLDEDEQYLARNLLLIFPRGVRPEDYVEHVRSWPCAAEVRLPPEISLP